MKKDVIALRNSPTEGLGGFEKVLRDQGYEIEYVDTPSADLRSVDPLSADLMVALGGPMGVYETETFPWLTDEIALLRARLLADRPTLGICLGSQLIAAALDARVFASGIMEVGWAPITLTEEGKASPLSIYGSPTIPLMHWHGDTFDLPSGATRLASSENFVNQAFRWSDNCLSVQFHPEVTQEVVELWMSGYAGDIGGIPGLTPDGLRAQLEKWSGLASERSKKMLETWLASTGG